MVRGCEGARVRCEEGSLVHAGRRTEPSYRRTFAPLVAPTLNPSYSYPDDFERIESSVADDRRDAASAPQIDHRPDRAEHSGRDHGVPALVVVSEAEGDAQHDHADGGAAEMLFEAAKQECPHQFLPDPASQDDNHSEHQRVERAAGGQL